MQRKQKSLDNYLGLQWIMVHFIQKHVTTCNKLCNNLCQLTWSAVFADT